MKQIFCIIFLLLAQNVLAQVVITDTEQGTTISLGEKLTQEQVVERLGVPSNQWKQKEDEAFGGDVSTYEYADADYLFVDDCLVQFTVTSLKYQISIHNKYLVKVGQSYYEFKEMIPNSDNIIRPISNRKVEVYLHCESSLIIEYDENGNITTLSWHAPV